MSSLVKIYGLVGPEVWECFPGIKFETNYGEGQINMTVEKSKLCIVLKNYFLDKEMIDFLVKNAEKNENDEWILDLATIEDDNALRILMKQGLNLFVDFLWKWTPQKKTL